MEITLYAFADHNLSGSRSFETRTEAEELRQKLELGAEYQIRSGETEPSKTKYWIEPFPRIEWCASSANAKEWNKLGIPLQVRTVRLVGVVQRRPPIILVVSPKDGSIVALDLIGPVPSDWSSLSEAASKLVRECEGADYCEFGVEGGYATLAQITEEVGRKTVFQNPSRGTGYSGEKLEEATFKIANGASLELWVFGVGYFEGYQAGVFDSRRKAFAFLHRHLDARAKTNWVLTECLECGAAFDKAGFVEPGGMGCKRCNG